MKRRAVAASVLRALLTATALTWLYFAVPVSGIPNISTSFLLLTGLVTLSVLLAWQIRSITRSPSPRLRAIEVLATAAPLFLLLFAFSYFLMTRNDPSAFSQPLSRLDALYFTVTVFATVGFGDLVAQSQAARSVVTVQMVGDLVFIGFFVRMLLGAVQVGLTRRGGTHPTDVAQEAPGRDPIDQLRR